ncbi:hypothetical protein Tco_0911786, partial [Tanacetum coccineum]
NSMEHVLSPLPFTKEAVHSLNTGSVNFQDAPALFNVDLSTFKAMLVQINIFVWKEPNGGLVGIHGGDYEINILFRSLGRCYVVKGSKSFEDVIRMLEKQLKLSPGCYKLTYKHPNRSVRNVWVKTDRDWQIAVLLSKLRGYFVLLNLEVFPSSQTADEDACDYKALDEDLTDDDFYLEDFDEDDYVDPVFVEDFYLGSEFMAATTAPCQAKGVIGGSVGIGETKGDN